MQNSKFRMQIQTAKNTKYKKGNVRAEVIGASSECAWCGISVKLWKRSYERNRGADYGELVSVMEMTLAPAL